MDHKESISKAYDYFDAEDFENAITEATKVKEYLENIDTTEYAEYPGVLLLIADAHFKMKSELPLVAQKVQDVLDYYLKIFETDVLNFGAFDTFQQTIEFFLYTCTEGKLKDQLDAISPKLEEAYKKQVEQFPNKVGDQMMFYMFLCRAVFQCGETAKAKEYQDLAGKLCHQIKDDFGDEEGFNTQLSYIEELVE